MKEVLNFFTVFCCLSVDIICIQESNLNSSLSLRIPGHSALRSEYIHAGSFSPDNSHASRRLVVFAKQGPSYLSFFLLPSLLDTYSDYVKVNVSLKTPSLSVSQTFASPFCSSLDDSRSDSFSPSILSSFRNLFILGDFNCHYQLETQELITSHLRGEEEFDWVTLPTLLLSMILTLFLVFTFLRHPLLS